MSFDAFARAASRWAGSAPVFAVACLLIVGWGASGPLLRFSSVWQLTVNTATTVITFLMVFLIQHSQNEDTDEIKGAIAELVRALPQADDAKAPE